MKTRLRTSVLFALLLCLAIGARAQITIRGTVTDANGKMPTLADAHIGKYNDNEKNSKSYAVKNGRFEITLPSAGLYSLRVSAVDHEEVNIPLILEKSDKKIDLAIQLKSDDYLASPDNVRIVGDWNKFAFSTSEAMTPVHQANGTTTYTFERAATADTLSYQLLGVTGNGHSVNGTQADYSIYDGGGDYRSVIRTKPGEKVTITFDPAKVHYAANSELPIVTVTGDPFLQHAITLQRKADAMHDAAMIMPEGAGPVQWSAEKYKALIEYLKSEIEKDKAAGNAKQAQFDAVLLSSELNHQFLTDGLFDAKTFRMIMETVPASSPMWILSHSAVEITNLVGDSNYGANYRKQLQSNPENSVRAVALADAMLEAHERNNNAEWRRLYAILNKDYADVQDIHWQLVQNNPDAQVQVGRHIPQFEVTTLDGSQKVSDKSMSGKYYMIDFWATWCGPCVGEMATMHKAYEKFKGKKGFEIVSLSMDAAEKNVANFRAKKWPMPWTHAFIPGIFDAELAKKFEVAGIPKPILVGPDGTILAMDNDMRGEELEKTLGKYLGQND